jgi:hypothetical protein
VEIKAGHSVRLGGEAVNESRWPAATGGGNAAALFASKPRKPLSIRLAFDHTLSMGGLRAERLIEFTDWVAKHITGDEKGESQILLDRLFIAFGHKGIKAAGGTLETRVKSRQFIQTSTSW